MSETTIPEMCEAEDIRRMTAAFYRRVRQDDLIGPMYPEEDWDGSEQRLAEFLWFRLGYPNRYLEMRGNPRLRMRHMPFRIGDAERDRWLELMAGAMADVGLPEAARVEMLEIFRQIADFMRNQPSEPSFRLVPPLKGG